MTAPGYTTLGCPFEAHDPARVSISVELISTAARLPLLLRMRIVVMWERRVDEDTNCRPCRVRGLYHCQRPRFNHRPDDITISCGYPPRTLLSSIHGSIAVKRGWIDGLQCDSVKLPAKVPGWPRKSQGGAFRFEANFFSFLSPSAFLFFTIHGTIPYHQSRSSTP